MKLDATQWRSAEDVWAALLEALGAPRWHGHNLDALVDSLRGGDLNATNPPLAVHVLGLGTAAPAARAEAHRIATVFADLSAGGLPVAWEQGSAPERAT